MSLDKICIIGCGNMGGACLQGWIGATEGIASSLSAQDFLCVVASENSRDAIRENIGAHCVIGMDALSSLGESALDFDLILLAVKPQILPEVMEDLAESPAMASEPLILSIAAGIPTKSIEEVLGGDVRVVRAMPNMPLQIREGATGICAGKNATQEDLALTKELFDALGYACVVDESKIDAVGAISGGGPAYVAYMVEALADAGDKLGLDWALAEELALKTVGGTYEAMAQNRISPEKMRESVCSPGGTTLAALSVLDSRGFKPMYEDAMQAAVDRAAELREGA